MNLGQISRYPLKDCQLLRVDGDVICSIWILVRNGVGFSEKSFKVDGRQNAFCVLLLLGLGFRV